MVRVATFDDIPVLVDIEQRLFPLNAMNDTMLERELAVGGGLVVGTVPCAYALLRDDGVRLDITRLGVVPEHQRKGFGELLLAHVVARGRRTMLTVAKSNRVALRLYLRHGFEVVGELTEAAAWLMERGGPSP
jgi:ribosomal protein S18 acetylase RimI-like enzyme